MPTSIVWLRGVMPKGKNKVPMAPLRSALEQAGLDAVRSYIQSGNLVVSTVLAQERLEALIHDVIAREFGGDIKVIARSVPYVRRALEANPYPEADPGKLYLTFLATEPEAERREAFIADCPDELSLHGDLIYILTPTTYSDLKVDNAFIERRLRVPTTTRVYRTVEKVLALAEAD